LAGTRKKVKKKEKRRKREGKEGKEEDHPILPSATV
jgi:hypothetical protein